MPLPLSVTDQLLIDTFVTGPLYAAAFLSSPSTTDGLTDGHEPTDPNYSRVVISFDLPSFGRVQTTTEIRFPPASIPWGGARAIGVCATPDTNTFIWYGFFQSDLPVNMGEILRLQYLSIGFQ
jgi:hypothetical protein